MKRCARLKSKLRHGIYFNAQQVGDPTVPKCFGIAKNIHQQCVRTIRAIQFHPSPVCPAFRFPRGSMDFFQPASPKRLRANSFVRSGVKIPVASRLVSTKDDAGYFTVQDFMEMFFRSREGQSTTAELSS